MELKAGTYNYSTFVTKRFKEIEPKHNLVGNELIRSEWSCRVDLLKRAIGSSFVQDT
jgi:hypothetical protein